MKHPVAPKRRSMSVAALATLALALGCVIGAFGGSFFSELADATFYSNESELARYTQGGDTVPTLPLYPLGDWPAENQCPSVQPLNVNGGMHAPDSAVIRAAAPTSALAGKSTVPLVTHPEQYVSALDWIRFYASCSQ